jgi:hypothetical protein
MRITKVSRPHTCNPFSLFAFPASILPLLPTFLVGRILPRRADDLSLERAPFG